MDCNIYTCLIFSPSFIQVRNHIAKFNEQIITHQLQIFPVFCDNQALVENIEYICKQLISEIIFHAPKGIYSVMEKIVNGLKFYQQMYIGWCTMEMASNLPLSEVLQMKHVSVLQAKFPHIVDMLCLQRSQEKFVQKLQLR